MIVCNGNQFEDTCTTTCNPGYELTGNGITTCLSNQTWSGTEVMCIEGITTNTIDVQLDYVIYTECVKMFSVHCLQKTTYMYIVCCYRITRNAIDMQLDYVIYTECVKMFSIHCLQKASYMYIVAKAVSTQLDNWGWEIVYSLRLCVNSSLESWNTVAYIE